MTYRVIRDRLGDNETLWRYMDLPKFLSLISSRSLWFARSDTFKDKLEGVFHDAMKLELEKIYNQFNESTIPSDTKIKNVSDFQNYLSDNTYISCWHKNNDENMVMWQLYGQSENSVAIKTTVSQLEKSFDLESVYKIALEFVLDDIQYIEHNLATSNKKYRQPFFIKRPYFSFEQEVRLYLLARNKKSRGEAPLGYSIELNINELIDTIYVHPDADEWFFDAIKDLLQKYELHVCVKRGLCGNKS